MHSSDLVAFATTLLLLVAIATKFA